MAMRAWCASAAESCTARHLRPGHADTITPVAITQQQSETMPSPAAFRFRFGLLQVDFEGSYGIEGAKEVSTVMTRHVSRLLRPWLAGQSQGETLQVCGSAGWQHVSVILLGMCDACAQHISASAGSQPERPLTLAGAAKAGDRSLQAVPRKGSQQRQQGSRQRAEGRRTTRQHRPASGASSARL